MLSISRKLVVPALFLSLAMALASAAKAEQAANLNAFCKARYGTQAEGTYSLSDNSPLCSVHTNNGLGLLHHRINAADVCQDQFGTRQFRAVGRQILCSDANVPAAAKKVIDLKAYCQKTYGPTALLKWRTTDNAPLCTVKGNGGLSQVHHVIDLSALCGNSVAPGAAAGGRLDCGGKPADQKSSTVTPADQRTPTVKPFNKIPQPPAAKVPASAIIPASRGLDLTGCGINPNSLFAGLGLHIAPPVGRRAANGMYEGWENGFVETPCAALKGGWRPDPRIYCPFIEPYDAVLTVLPGGRPICRPRDYLPPPETWVTLLPPICSWLYPKRADLVTSVTDANGHVATVGHLYPIIKLKGGVVECFYLDLGRAQKEKLKLMERTDGVLHEVTGNLDFYGGPFFYQVRFNEPRSETTLTVHVTADTQSDAEETDVVLSRVKGNDRLFRSDAFFILPPSYGQDIRGDEGSLVPGETVQP